MTEKTKRNINIGGGALIPVFGGIITVLFFGGGAYSSLQSSDKIALSKIERIDKSFSEKEAQQRLSWERQRVTDYNQDKYLSTIENMQTRLESAIGNINKNFETVIENNKQFKSEFSELTRSVIRMEAKVLTLVKEERTNDK